MTETERRRKPELFLWEGHGGGREGRREGCKEGRREEKKDVGPKQFTRQSGDSSCSRLEQTAPKKNHRN